MKQNPNLSSTFDCCVWPAKKGSKASARVWSVFMVNSACTRHKLQAKESSNFTACTITSVPVLMSFNVIAIIFLAVFSNHAGKKIRRVKQCYALVCRFLEILLDTRDVECQCGLTTMFFCLHMSCFFFFLVVHSLQLNPTRSRVAECGPKEEISRNFSRVFVFVTHGKKFSFPKKVFCPFRHNKGRLLSQPHTVLYGSGKNVRVNQTSGCLHS
jgi:hypothetical protein